MKHKPTYSRQNRNFKREKEIRGTAVTVRDNNMNGALRILKKIMTSEGVFKELRERRFYEKPSAKRNRAKAAAKKRWQKELASRDEE